jgi:hypothetical protein
MLALPASMASIGIRQITLLIYSFPSIITLSKPALNSSQTQLGNVVCSH